MPSAPELGTVITRALKALLNDKEKEFSGKPDELKIKILAQAIAWEKVRKGIKEKDEQFNPDNL